MAMQAPEGGYYASLDADSDGEEGKFYRWDKKKFNRYSLRTNMPLFRYIMV